MEAISLADLSLEASVIVVGTVRARSSEYDEFGRIVTDHHIEVHEVWKGPKHFTSVLMRSLGGEVGELAMTVPGAPHLGVGQTALFFLRPSALRNPSPTWLKPLGMSQGVFRITAAHVNAPGGGVTAPTVMPGGQGLRLLKFGPDGAPVEAGSAVPTPTELDDLRRAVLLLLNQQVGRQ